MYGEDLLDSWASDAAPIDYSALSTGADNFDASTFMPAISGMGDAAGAPDVAGWASKFLDPLGKFASSLGSAVTEKPIDFFAKALGLGSTGLGLANAVGAIGQENRQNQLLQRGQDLAFSAAQPAVNYGNELLQTTKAGQLPAPVEARLADWAQRAKADKRAQLARMGISDSTALSRYMDEIDAKVEEVRAALLSGQGDQALRALGLGATTGAQAGQIGANQQQQIAQILDVANRSLNLMGARG